MNDAYETIEYKGCTIEIRADEGMGDPFKEYDHVGTIIGREHSRYIFGQEQVSLGGWHEQNTWRDELGAIDGRRRMAWVVPMSHSDYDSSWSHGDLMRVQDVSADDTDTDAYYVLYRDRVLSEAPGTPKILTPAAKAWAKQCAGYEIDEYSHWSSGQVFGWLALDEQGEHIDSCSGFYEDWDEYPLTQAKEAIDHYVSKRESKAALAALAGI